MTPKQMIDFDARREAVLRAHLKQNPKYRTLIRNRRVAIAAGIVRYLVAVGIVLFLIKAFLLAQNGPGGYQAMVAPVLSSVPADGLVARAIAPDSYSMKVASTMAELTASSAPTADAALDGIERITPTTNGS